MLGAGRGASEELARHSWLTFSSSVKSSDVVCRIEICPFLKSACRCERAAGERGLIFAFSMNRGEWSTTDV